jgi:hypothetical protein
MDPNVSSNPTNLDLLPSEIIWHILMRIADLRTLQALIRASLCYFQVYRASEKAVLSSVTRNQIPPAVFPITVDALEQRKLRGPRNDRKAVIAFVENFRKVPHKEQDEFSL